MTNQEFINAVYDLIAQNPMKGAENDFLTDLVDYVDTDRNSIVFRNAKGKEFELQLVETYAPAPEKSWRGYTFADFQAANPELSETEAIQHYAQLRNLPL